MQIVPIGDRLPVEARISPRDIGFVAVGDPANVKVTAYDVATYGGLSGEVVEVSADSIYEEVKCEAYYRVLVENTRRFVEKGGRQFPTVPGMITDAEIVTVSKRILAYLLKPVTRAFDTALSAKYSFGCTPSVATRGVVVKPWTHDPLLLNVITAR